MASYYAETKHYQSFLKSRQNTTMRSPKKIVRRILGGCLVVIAVIFRQYLFLAVLGSLFFLSRVLIKSEKLMTHYHVYPTGFEGELFHVTVTPEHLRVRVKQNDLTLSQKNVIEIHPYSSGVFLGHTSGIKLLVPEESLHEEEKAIITSYIRKGVS